MTPTGICGFDPGSFRVTINPMKRAVHAVNQGGSQMNTKAAVAGKGYGMVLRGVVVVVVEGREVEVLVEVDAVKVARRAASKLVAAAGAFTHDGVSKVTVEAVHGVAS